MSSIVYLDVDKIHANKYNPNVMSQEKFEALVDFCETHGAEQLDPIWVRHDCVDKFEVIDGEHRWKAAKEVGWKRLRAFIIDMGEEDARAFNVRKNRERGKLDIFKLGKLMWEERQKGLTCEAINKKYGYFASGHGGARATEYIKIYENKDLILSHLPEGRKWIGKNTALKILRELKREEKGETIEELSLEEPIESQQLEKFLHRYARALKNNPLPNIQKDEVETAIDFFKRLLENKQVHCPICGEKHLQWSCGHEF